MTEVLMCGATHRALWLKRLIIKCSLYLETSISDDISFSLCIISGTRNLSKWRNEMYKQQQNKPYMSKCLKYWWVKQLMQCLHQVMTANSNYSKPHLKSVYANRSDCKETPKAVQQRGADQDRRFTADQNRPHIRSFRGLFASSMGICPGQALHNSDIWYADMHNWTR